MSRRLIVFAAFWFVFAVSFAQAQEVETGPIEFSGDLAYQHVADQVAFGPRIPATAANLNAGNHILNTLASIGWAVSEDWHVIDFGAMSEMDETSLTTFEYWNPITVGSSFGSELTDLGLEPVYPINFDPIVIPVRNLVASYGTGPTIIIGAHYDSRLFGDKDDDPNRRLDPIDGANDGGSGVGVMMEMARVIAQHYRTNYEIRFIFFDAEDQGRIAPWDQLALGAGTGGYAIGSILYAGNLDMTVENIQYMLLLDLVGEFDQQFPIEAFSNQSAPQITADMWSIAADLGYADQFPTDVRSAIIDDHLAFIQRGIPSVDIIDLEYEYWDTTEDTLDKISAESLERVGRVVIAYLERTGVIERIQ